MDKRFSLPLCWIVLGVVLAIAVQLRVTPSDLAAGGAAAIARVAGPAQVVYVVDTVRPVLEAWVAPLVFGVLFAVMTALGVTYAKWLGWLQLATYGLGWLLIFGPGYALNVLDPAQFDPVALSDVLNGVSTAGYALEALSALAFTILAAGVIRRLLLRRPLASSQSPA